MCAVRSQMSNLVLTDGKHPKLWFKPKKSKMVTFSGLLLRFYFLGPAGHPPGQNGVEKGQDPEG